jgi:anti-sigma factor RsiW
MKYLLGALPRERRTAFEEHYIGCPDCVERLQFTEEFVQAVRPAAAQLKSLTARAYEGAIQYYP